MLGKLPWALWFVVQVSQHPFFMFFRAVGKPMQCTLSYELIKSHHLVIFIAQSYFESFLKLSSLERCTCGSFNRSSEAIVSWLESFNKSLETMDQSEDHV